MNINEKIEKSRNELKKLLNAKENMDKAKQIKYEKEETVKDIEVLNKLTMKEKLQYIETVLQYVGDLPSDYHFDRYLEKSNLVLKELKDEWQFK